MPLTDDEFELMDAGGRDAELFRNGALCEARLRAEENGVHRELVDCAEVLARNHQGLSSGEIAIMLARIFNHVINEESV